MTTQEAAAALGVAHITARKWAAANGVNYTGVDKRKTYVWTEKDMERFKARPSPGWKKGRPRKPAGVN
jgi:cytochrome c2